VIVGGTFNDYNRAIWVQHDAELHALWEESGEPLKKFVRDNRGLIDEVIRGGRSGRKSWDVRGDEVE
jgi:hypothetical protein